MSVNGTHCPIFEPWPFDKKLCLHKLNGSGLSHEVGVCIKMCHIVWTNGPFVASTNNGVMFKNSLTNLLCNDEAVEVDAGHKGDHKMKTPDVGFNSSFWKEKIIVQA